MGRVVDLWSPAIGAAGTVIRYGHWGRPVLVFPIGARPGVGLRDQRHGRRRRRPDRRGPGQALLRRQLRRRVLVEPRRSRSRSGRGGTARTSRGSSTRSCRGSTPTAAARRRAHHRLQHGRLPRGQLRPHAAPTCSRWRCACRATTTRPPGTAGASAATRRTSTNPTGLRRPPARRPPGLAAPPASACCSSAGRACGRTPPARWPARARSPALLGREGHPARARRVGATTSPHDWPWWRAPARPPPAADSAETGGEPLNQAPGRAAARHRGGLARGLRGAPAAARVRSARARAARTPSTSSGSPSSRSTCATSRATTWSSTGSRTGTTTRASGSRRSR